jgi:hypothetical protein
MGFSLFGFLFGQDAFIRMRPWAEREAISMPWDKNFFAGGDLLCRNLGELRGEGKKPRLAAKKQHD